MALVLVGAAVGLRPLLGLLHEGWSERYGHFEHGYLVLALAVWMGIRYWQRLPPQRLAPTWWALGPLLATIAALGLLELMFINSARLSLLPLMFIAAVALVLGRLAATRLFWPAMFVYFALPQWWAINGVMQSLTTAMVTRMVGWTGVPAFIEGNFVHVPAGIFEIASGCSGLNYLLVGMSLGGFYALMYLRDTKHQLALLGVAIALALVSNWIRVYSLILIGHLSDMQHYLITVEHHVYGWVLFLVLMAPMLLVARRLEDREDAAVGVLPALVGKAGEASPGQPQSGIGVQVAARPAATGRVATGRVATGRASMSVARGLLPAAILAALVFFLPRAFHTASIEGPPPPAPLPATLAGYPMVDVPLSPWQPVFVNSASDHAGFDDGRGVVEVYRAVYARQDRDHRLVRPGNGFIGDAFRVVEESRREIETSAGTFKVSTYRGHLAGEERLVWAWYWVAGRAAATPLEAKIAELRGLPGGRRDGVAVALSARCHTDCAATDERLADFLVDAVADMRRLPAGAGNISSDDTE